MKNTISFALATLMMTTAVASLATANGAAKEHVVLVIDKHSSNPVRNADYVKHAIQSISAAVQQQNLEFLDKVSIRSAGDPNPMSHMSQEWHQDVLLQHRVADPKYVPDFFAERLTAFANAPDHSQSDLVSALSRLPSSIDCKNVNLTAYIVSNVVDGGYVSENEYVYPEFSGAPFAECGYSKAVLVGFGVQAADHSAPVINAAKTLVTSIFQDAGFDQVIIKQ